MTAPRDLDDRAARWIIRREQSDWTLESEDELRQWLAESDAHKAAFWRLEHGWKELDRIAALGAPIAHPAKVAPAIGWWRPLALAASLLLVAFVFLMQRVDAPSATENLQEARLETPWDARKSMILSDGSRIELNTDTLVTAVLAAEARSVRLQRGEAFFDVRKNPARPFTVIVGSRTVTVLGTRFSVRRRNADVTVFVAQGNVQLKDRAQSGSVRTALLTAGDIAVASGQALLVTSPGVANIEQRLAWRTGNLVFDETTLGEAAEQFNRYNRTKLVIATPEVARTRIGGTFRTNEVGAFARLLADAYGLKVEMAPDKIVVRS